MPAAGFSLVKYTSAIDDHYLVATAGAGSQIISILVGVTRANDDI